MNPQINWICLIGFSLVHSKRSVVKSIYVASDAVVIIIFSYVHGLGDKSVGDIMNRIEDDVLPIHMCILYHI